jgi:hypothetical protein
MLLSGKWVELGEHHIEQSKSDSKGQRSHIFHHMWNLDIWDKCTHTYMIYIHICMYVWRETQSTSILVGVSEWTMRTEKEWEYQTVKNIETFHLCMKIKNKMHGKLLNNKEQDDKEYLMRGLIWSKHDIYMSEMPRTINIHYLKMKNRKVKQVLKGCWGGEKSMWGRRYKKGKMKANTLDAFCIHVWKWK